MRTTDRTEYGARVQQARKRKGWSQQTLAAAVGMSQSGIGELETKGSGSLKTVEIAAALGVRAEWLTTGEGPMTEGDEVPAAANTVASEHVAHYLVGTPASRDYRTVALSLAAALEETETDVTVSQFIKLVEATYRKLQP